MNMNEIEKVNPLYRIEADKLVKGLEDKDIDFDYHCCWDGVQIRCNEWDAVCHSGSYGHEKGLLEIMALLLEQMTMQLKVGLPQKKFFQEYKNRS